MIDVTNEELITLAQARELIPGRVNLSTVYRWCFKGVRGVRLSTVLIGGARRTSRAALNCFFQATTAAADARLVNGPPKVAERPLRALAQQAVENELSRRGF